MDNLSDTLKKLKITAVDRTDDSLEGCLDCLLQALTQNNMETSEKIQGSGILQVFASLLIPQSSCTAKVANVIAEIAKNEFMRIPCVDAGLISPLVQLLNSKDQEVLLQTGRALGNICYDSLYGLPWCLSGKESTCSAGAAGDMGLIAGSGRSPGRGHGNPLQYSSQENPMDRGVWWAAVHRVAKEDTTEEPNTEFIL